MSELQETIDRIATHVHRGKYHADVPVLEPRERGELAEEEWQSLVSALEEAPGKVMLELGPDNPCAEEIPLSPDALRLFRERYGRA